MDPVLMVGAWAAALLSVIGLGRVLYHAFIRAVKAAIREELDRVWKDQDEIERRLDALEQAMAYLRRQVDALTVMMQAHISDRQQ